MPLSLGNVMPHLQGIPQQFTGKYHYLYLLLGSFIHSLVFSLRDRAGRNQSSVMWLVWLWHTASWASSWGSLSLLSPTRIISY